MTRFAGLSLRADDDTPGSGAAFVLRDGPHQSRTVEHGGWTIDVIKGTKTVVARGFSSRTYDRAVEDGFTAANIGLDLMCFTSSERLLIDKYDEEHVTWWPSSKGGELTVAASAKHVSELGMSATAVVADADGTVQLPAPTPQLIWHPSYRYFRVSQTTTDLHDAYRNAFLALESLLDHLTPQRRGEREGDWFARAMSAAEGLVTQAAHLHPSDADPVRAIVNEFYKQWRTAVAHSKSSRVFVLPNDAPDRLDLTNSLGRLTGYYVSLATAVFGAGRAVSSFTQHLFKVIAKGLGEYDVYISDDGAHFDPDDPRPAPSGGSLVPMTPTGGMELSGPFLARRTWASAAAHLTALPVVRRMVGVKDGEAGFVLVLEADLELEDSDTLEARFAFSTISRTDLRKRYAT